RCRVEQGRVDAVAPGGKHAVLVRQAASELVGPPDGVVLLVVLDVEALPQLLDDIVERRARYEDFLLHLVSEKRKGRPCRPPPFWPFIRCRTGSSAAKASCPATDT